jgi:hypothetical protein
MVSVASAADDSRQNAADGLPTCRFPSSSRCWQSLPGSGTVQSDFLFSLARSEHSHEPGRFLVALSCQMPPTVKSSIDQPESPLVTGILGKKIRARR